MGSSPSLVRASLALALLGAPLAAQATERVSVSTGGAQGTGSSPQGSVSSDGRFVVFESSAKLLGAGDTNSASDIFVRDVLAGTTELVSLSSGGVQGDRASTHATISADGRFVAFRSEANNLVPGDTNLHADIFLRDRLFGTTHRVSLANTGVEGNDFSDDPAISADGKLVAFTSWATNLVPGDANGSLDVFVRDWQAGTTEIVSVATGGGQGNSNSNGALSISADGRFVGFTSSATNLVAGDANGSVDVFLRDRQGATTEIVSVDSNEVPGNASSFRPSLSADGRYVAFSSLGTNLVVADANGSEDVFRRDRSSGTTELVSLDSGGGLANGASVGPAISADGRYVAFSSAATDLVPGDTNGFSDAFRRDLFGGSTERFSLESSGVQGDDASTFPSISSDGRRVAFASAATNLVPGDTNGAIDIFFRDLGASGTQIESGGLGGAPANGASAGPAISPDCRFVAFESSANNLVVADVNGVRDIFLNDHQTNTTVLVSVDSAGVQADADSFHPVLSADGRFVAFDSAATNLVAGDTNGLSDVFVRDLLTNTTTRVSVGPGGAEGLGASFHPAISTDGRYVAFDSDAQNLVAGDSNLTVDVFLRDRQISQTTRVSVDSGGTQGAMASTGPTISADGRFVAFESLAQNLVAGDGNGVLDVFVRDVQTSTTTRASVATGGAEGNGASSNAAISGDGLHVAFESDASNLVAGDTNVTVDVFVRGSQTGVTDRVSVDSGGTQGAMASTDPTITFDGREVGFASAASNLVAGDTNGAVDVFLNDRLTGQTSRVSVDSGGTQGASASGGPAVSGDGGCVVFESLAGNLVFGDTNGLQDTFTHEEGSAAAFVAFCAGDGTVGPCPCGNTGGAGHGCQNSSFTGGARLTVTGIAKLTADTVQFTSSGEKPTALSIFLQGTAPIAAVPYGDGLRCTGGSLKRLYAKSADNGVVVAPVPGDMSVSARSAFLNQAIPLGSTRQYQVYYRDVNPSSFCPPPLGSNFNASNGMLVAWGG